MIKKESLKTTHLLKYFSHKNGKNEDHLENKN